MLNIKFFKEKPIRSVEPMPINISNKVTKLLATEISTYERAATIIQMIAERWEVKKEESSATTWYEFHWVP